MATSRKVSEKLCPLCSFEAPTVAIILGHLRTVHSSDPHFLVICGLDGCATTSRSFSALYSHIYRHHQTYIRKRSRGSVGTKLSVPNEVSGRLQSQMFDDGLDVTDQIETGMCFK